MYASRTFVVYATFFAHLNILGLIASITL
jgi:hypothetical protein